MRDDIQIGPIHGYSYDAAPTADYVLLIVHGIGGHGGTYDVFCEPMAARGVQVFSMDLPGHGKARNARGNFRFTDWLEDIDYAAHALRAKHGRKVFVLGSSQGSAAAFHSLAWSEAVTGAITMGLYLRDVPANAGTPAAERQAQMINPEADRKAELEGDSARIDLATYIDWNKNYAKDEANVLEKKRQDPLRAWSYGYASMHSYTNFQPTLPLADNVKPVLLTVGEDDPLIPSEYVRRCFAAIGGPKELAVVPGGTHQLMLYHTSEYVPLVDSWVRRQL